jgi:(2Fe-2S) ferredoxin
MPTFTHHVFVCCNRREPGHSRGCCDPEGAGRLREALKARLKQRNLGELLVRVNQAGCLDQCEYGPNLVIYPQGIWYGRVTLDDLDRIIEETILGGRIIEELRIPDECLNTKGKVPWVRERKSD